MRALTSVVMKSVMFTVLAASLSACAPVLALAPLAAGVSLIALDKGAKAAPHAATATGDRDLYPEALSTVADAGSEASKK